MNMLNTHTGQSTDNFDNNDKYFYDYILGWSIQTTVQKHKSKSTKVQYVVTFFLIDRNHYYILVYSF